MNGRLSAAAEAMHGELIGDDAGFAGVSTDTRSIGRGELFIALTGPNFDGAEFVAGARRRGAAGAVVGRRIDDALPQILVEDTRRALGELAAHWRRQQSAVVIGITGSNGKTTLKELTAACVAQAGPTLATAGNLNNDIGVPLMLLRLRPEHRYAVIEMGANHGGEIAYLTELASPNVVTITNAGAAHLEGFGSIEGVARGKGEILQGRPRPDCAVLNADDDYYEFWRTLADDIEVLSFGLEHGADVRADEISLERGRTRFLLRVRDAVVPVTLPLAGRHNVRNACAAAAIATFLGIAPDDIATALADVRPVGGRLAPVPGRNGAALYDDSYNANPLSVVAAARFLAALPGRAWMVLGDMKELGAEAERLHAEVGEQIREAGIERLFATGELCRHTVEAFGEGALWCAETGTLGERVLEELTSDVNVLVKGSRSMRMERVIDGLREPEPLRRKA